EGTAGDGGGPVDALGGRKGPHRRSPRDDAARRILYDLDLGKEIKMARLALLYGMRLLPADEVEEVGEAEIRLKNGKTAHVTMHLIEGGEREIRKQLEQSLDAFFEFYPEI